jgi:hypothetical protein
MMDIINPWRALRRARAELEASHRAFWEAHWEADMHRVKLEALIAKAHFRNPKTGRIGRKGETFE